MAMQERGSTQMMFWRWWYAEAVTSFWRFMLRFGSFVADFFSVRLCLMTLFDVWRRDEIDSSNLSLQEKLSVWSLNSASRFVGFVVKTFVLFGFAVSYLFVWFVGLLVYALYLIFPLLIVGLFAYSLVGLFLELFSKVY